jgi:hypothetical protein
MPAGEDQEVRRQREHRENPDALEVRQTPPVAIVYPRTQIFVIVVIAIELALQLLGVGGN